MKGRDVRIAVLTSEIALIKEQHSEGHVTDQCQGKAPSHRLSFPETSING
jgi:hypothetical protein